MRHKLLILLFSAMTLLCIVGIVACKKLPSSQSSNTTEPMVLKAPTATDIAVGESTDVSKLYGEFSVEGELKFSDEAIVPLNAGKIEREWKFIPYDTVNYKNISGKVVIEVYRYRLKFEENGGFEVEDEFFNESFTIKNKPLTAKNDYRFDGWMFNGTLIEYPKTFTSSATLYATYRFHTEDKVFYNVADGICYAEASWKTYWEKEGDYEAAAKNYFPIGEVNSQNSIAGEVIIADMHNGLFVTSTRWFCTTRISSIIFNNFTYSIESMGKTLLKSVSIPNTAVNIADGAFSDSAELESVIYEGGEGAFEMDGEKVLFGYKLRTLPALKIANCPKLKKIEYHNVKEMGAIINCGIEEVTVPADVEILGTDAFYGCTALKEVIFEEGSKLKEVKSRAFGNCKSLEKISIPECAKIYASAFYGCNNLNEIDITDEQITDIVRHLHGAFIDSEVVGETYCFVENDDFNINIARGEQYLGEITQGGYVAGSEEINLYMDKFSIQALTTLCHEFFHHFQYVLCNGIKDEDWDSVPLFNTVYFYETNMMHISPTVFLSKDNWEIICDKYEYGEDKTGGWITHIERPIFLINEERLNLWKQRYVSLNEDKSNFDEYWNQPLESDARKFASWFTGVNYEGDTSY